MATVTASYNWVSGETVTPAKLNTTAAPTVVVADNEVTTAKILDANVTNAKLASDIDASKLTTGTLPIARIADAAVTPAKLSQPLTLATAQNTTSGTSIDFTGIPSWAKRITVMLNGVSTNGTSHTQVQVGAGSFTTSGYVGGAGFVVNAAVEVAVTTNSTGLKTDGYGAGADTRYGTYFLTNFSGNTWMFVGNGNTQGTNNVAFASGQIALTGTLDRVRLTTVNGTDDFDAGSVNIMYEG
jgi:hypothetical protein